MHVWSSLDSDQKLFFCRTNPRAHLAHSIILFTCSTDAFRASVVFFEKGEVCWICMRIPFLCVRADKRHYTITTCVLWTCSPEKLAVNVYSVVVFASVNCVVNAKSVRNSLETLDWSRVITLRTNTVGFSKPFPLSEGHITSCSYIATWFSHLPERCP